MIKKLKQNFKIVKIDDTMKIQNINNKEINEVLDPYVAVILKLFDGIRPDEDIKKIISYLSKDNLSWQKVYRKTLKMYGHFLEEVDYEDISEKEADIVSIKEILYLEKESTSKKYILHRRMVPTKIMWMISEKCSRRCKYCYLGSETKSFVKFDDNDISDAKIETLAEECYELGVKEIIFSGGDPLTCKNIYEICNLFLGHGLDVSVITKMKINPLKLINMPYKTLSFMFSLDSIVDKTADELAGYKGHCKEMQENFLLCDKLNIRYVVSITVCKNNFYEITETVKALIENFHGNVMISKYSSFGNDGSPYEISGEKYKDLCQELICYVKEQNYEMRLIINSQTSNKDQKPCDAGREKMAIDSKGNAIMCEKIFSPKLSLNVFEQGVIGIWNSNEYKELFGFNSDSSEFLETSRNWKCPIKCN